MKAPELLKLDPELEHLLHELAAEPESSLLRVARPAVLPALFESESVVSQHATGLLPVERELLRAHRAELAEVLLDLCRQKLVTEDRYRLFMTGLPQVPARGRLRAMPEILDARARFNPEFEAGDARDASVVITRCLSGSISSRPSVQMLAAAAQRIWPTWSAVGNSAIALALDGQPRTALRLFSRIMKETTDTAIHAHSWASMGLAHSLLLQTKAMTDAYGRACEMQPERVTPWICRLAGSLLLGDTASVERCTYQAAQLNFERDPRLERYLSCLQVRARRGEWRLDPLQAREVASTGKRLGGIVERFAHAIATP